MINRKIITTFLISELVTTSIWAKGLTNISPEEIASLEKYNVSTEVIANLDNEESPEIAFFNRYNITMFSSQNKLTIMHKRGNISKLGKEVISGEKSGTLKYHARIKGLGGDVKMIFKDYCDFDGFIVNGESNVTAKMNMRGHMYGTVIVTDSNGVEQGRIVYDKLEIVKGIDGGGGYTVTLPGREPVWVEWDKVLRIEREEEDIGMDERK